MCTQRGTVIGEGRELPSWSCQNDYNLLLFVLLPVVNDGSQFEVQKLGLSGLTGQNSGRSYSGAKICFLIQVVTFQHRAIWEIFPKEVVNPLAI